MDLTDDDFVETSDVEELEELGNEGKRLAKSSSPRRSPTPSLDEETWPRKRLKLFHETFMVEDEHEEPHFPTSPMLSSATPTSPTRTQSSSTVPNIDSPGMSSLLWSSQSPTRTPITSPKNLLRKWDHEMSPIPYAPPSTLRDSQDPFLVQVQDQLLESPGYLNRSLSDENLPKANADSPCIVTSIHPEPPCAPQTPQRSLKLPQSSQSPDPLSLFETLSPSHVAQDHGNISSPSENEAFLVDDGPDELSSFSPSKTLPHVLSSPLTPSPQPSSPLQAEGNLFSSPAGNNPLSPARSISPISLPKKEPPPVVIIRAEENQDAAVAAAFNAEQGGSRYSLRKRNIAQINPYSVENQRYKLALKSNPDAIVNFKHLERHLHQRHPNDRYKETGETQEDGYVLEDGDDPDADVEWKERERKRERRAEKERHLEAGPSTIRNGEASHYPAILQDLPSTDDEEREMDATLKEARKLLRAKEKQRKAEEKEERRRQREGKLHRPHPYPLSKPKYSHTGPSTFADRHLSRGDTIEGQDTEAQLDPSKHPTPTSHVSPVVRNVDDERPRTSSPSNENNIILNYFGEGDDFDMYGADNILQDGFNEPGPSQSHSPSRSPSRSSDGFLRNLYKDPIDIVSDEEEQGKRLRRLSHSSSSDTDDAQIDLPRSKRRLLGRMMPAFMINKLAKQATVPKASDRRVSPPTPDAEDNGPLLPGQTRSRKTTNSKDLKDIRGDSESETELRRNSLSSSSSSEESDSDSDSVEILNTYRPTPPKYREPEVIDVDFSGSEGDADIRFFVEDKQPSRRNKGKARLRDQSMIDYMLPRTYTTGGGKVHKPSKRPRQSRSSGYKLDIMTRNGRGYGRERQTLLSFNGHKKRKRHRDSSEEPIAPRSHTSDSRPSIRRSFAATSGKTYVEDPGHIGGADYVHTVLEPKQMSRKERQKLRRSKGNTNGIYSFPSGHDRHITTGRRANAAFFTVDLEDEGFHSALAPSSIAGGRHDSTGWYEPPPPQRIKQRLHVPSSNDRSDSSRAIAVEENPQVDSTSGNQRRNLRNLTSDLGVRVLHSGKSFNSSTYIRKGCLHELISVVSAAQDPLPPSSVNLCGFNLGPTMGVDKICSTLPSLCDALFEFATGLPDPDFDTSYAQWKLVIRVVPQIVSWYLKTGMEHERINLRQVVEIEVQKLVGAIEKLSVSFIDTPLLSMCWFLVELSTRLGTQLPTSYATISNPIKASSKILLRILLQFGIQKTSELLQSNANVDGATTADFATELWVCLIHVLLGGINENSVSSKYHPFWTAFLEVVQSRNSDTASLKGSEDMWLTIFTVCALSQFSVHGMTTAEPRLPACWDLVAFALKKIRLSGSTEDQHRHSSVLQKRDHYIALVTSRCSVLRETWQWRLNEGSSMFNQLADIFRSRNFANLRHEGLELPKFFVHQDWKLLTVYDTTDTAFATFLKLVVQANEDDKNGQRKSSAKIKKLLSLAVPLGNLNFTTTNLPRGLDITMFYNRLSAIAVSIFLNVDEYDERTKKARTYITFSSADPKTRHAIICGILRLATLMAKRDIQITAMLEWIEEISKILESEIKLLTPQEQDPPDQDLPEAPTVRLARHLLLATRDIARIYLALSRPPDPSLLPSLKPILNSQWMGKSDTVKEQLAALLDAVFSARSKALPLPPRPARVYRPNLALDEESQEWIVDDQIDWNAISSDAPMEAKLPLNEDKFLEIVKNRIKWVVYGHLKSYLLSPPPYVMFKTYANDCDKWLRLLICCFDTQKDEERWDNFFQLVDGLLKKDESNAADNSANVSWGYRVNLSIMFQLLQIHPMAYMNKTCKDRAIQVLFVALVADTLTLESQFVSFLLSIDYLEHPLFADAADSGLPTKRDSEDFEFSPDQFSKIRVVLIRVILKNINRSLSEEDAGSVEKGEDNREYLDLCFNMLSRMRSIRSSLLQTSNERTEKLTNYTAFCLEVLHAIQENPLVRAKERLKFFNDWARTLVIP